MKTKKKKFFQSLNFKIELVFVFFLILLSIEYFIFISRIVTPGWDGSVYLLNAKSWLNGAPLYESFRSPLFSWIVAGLFSVGLDWFSVRFLNAIFTIGSGIILYLTVKKGRGNLFSFGTASLTMLNPLIFFYSTLILTNGIALFFLVA